MWRTWPWSLELKTTPAFACFSRPRRWQILLRLRSGCPVTRIPIWIDALCINQRDKDEKAVQVRRMDQIYKGAKAVFAWLGEPDDYTSTGFGTISKLSELDRRVAPNYALHRSRDISEYGFEEWEWTSLVALLRRAWFTRVWVIQEVWFANRIVIVCGNSIQFARHSIARDRAHSTLTCLNSSTESRI